MWCERWCLVLLLHIRSVISRWSKKLGFLMDGAKRGKLGVLAGICEFHLIYFRHCQSGSRFPKTSANSLCDVTGRHRSLPTWHCVMLAVEYSVPLS